MAHGIVLRALLVTASIGAGVILGRQVFTSPARPPGGVVIRPGEEILLVLIGSSACAAAKDPVFDEVFTEIARQLEIEARSRNAAFRRVGVATDWSLDLGFRFLERFGPFDELVVGRSWLSSGYDRYVRTSRGADGIPQVIVLTREIIVHDSTIAFRNERRLASVVGTDSIKAWLGAGTPLTPSVWDTNNATRVLRDARP